MSGAEQAPVEKDQQRKALALEAQQAARGMPGTSPTAAYILRLQRTAGNQAVGALLRRYRGMHTAAHGPARPASALRPIAVEQQGAEARNSGRAQLPAGSTQPATGSGMVQRLVEPGATPGTPVIIIATDEEGEILQPIAGGYRVRVERDERDYTYDQLDPRTRLGRPFGRFPHVFEPITRRGHNFPERQALHGDTTLAALLINHNRLVSQESVDQRVEHPLTPESREASPMEAADMPMLSLDSELMQLMGVLLGLNSRALGPMREVVELVRRYHQLMDEAAGTGGTAPRGEEEARRDDPAELRAHIDSGVERVGALLAAGPDAEYARSLLDRWFRALFWTNQSSGSATQQSSRRKQQLEHRARIRKSGAFSAVSGDYNKEDMDEPYATAGHAEQTLLVSQQWRDIKGRLLRLLQGDTHEGCVVTISLNRSPCPACISFLIPELIEFWELAARESRPVCATWQEARELLRGRFRFELTYSTVYTDSLARIKDFNAQLSQAGWSVFQHEQYSKEDDEVEFTQVQGQYDRSVESIREGARPRARAMAGTAATPSSASSRTRARTDSDDEYQPEGDQRPERRQRIQPPRQVALRAQSQEVSVADAQLSDIFAEHLLRYLRNGQPGTYTDKDGHWDYEYVATNADGSIRFLRRPHR